MSGFAKLFSSIVTSTIWREADHVRLVWITMLAIADRHGVVEASVPGLADLARVDLTDCVAALKRLAEPDEWSRTKEHEGRRIAEIPGGWRLLNYAAYRDRRGAQDDELSMSPEAVRQRRHRANRGVTERDSALQTVTDGDADVTLSASASASVSENQELQQEPVRRVVAESSIFSLGDRTPTFTDVFGEYAGDVVGLIHSSRRPESIIGVLRGYLQGIDGKVTDGVTLGRAVQEYLATDPQTFNPAYFSGFVSRTRGRKAQARETAAIDAGKVDRVAEEAAADQAAAAKRRAVASFEKDYPDSYAEIVEQAEELVDPKHVRGRGILVRGKIIELIEQSLARRNGNNGGNHASA